MCAGDCAGNTPNPGGGSLAFTTSNRPGGKGLRARKRPRRSTLRSRGVLGRFLQYVLYLPTSASNRGMAGVGGTPGQTHHKLPELPPYK